MARIKESALSDAQIQDMSIVKLTFHIIDVSKENEERVIPVTEISLDADQLGFFLRHIKTVATGIQYEFIDGATHTKNPCKALSSDEVDFAETSRELTVSFASHHRKNMASGVFVVASLTLSAVEGRKPALIFIAKFDHKNVYQIIRGAEANGEYSKASMKKLTDTLVEDKTAIQKSALIDVSDLFSWDVLASERKLKESGEITDYFKAFLGVKLMEVASTLTRRTVALTKKWAADIPDDLLPEGQTRGDFAYRAVAYMQVADLFDTGKFIAAVVRSSNLPQNKAKSLADSLRASMDDAGLSNQSFAPKPNSLPKISRKQVWKTSEGLIMEFQGEAADFGIKISDRSDGKPGKVLTITTQDVTTA